MADPAYLTVADAAEQLGYTTQHVRRLMRQGRLGGYKLGRDWVVRKDAVESYLARRANLTLPLPETSERRRTDG